MKLLTILGVAAICTITSSNAATVSVTGGFGTGVLVTVDGLSSTYSLDVGGFESNIFTAFASPAVNKAAGTKIAGSFAGVGPASLNSDAIFLRITTPVGFVILNSAAAFPADTSSALGSSTVSFTSSASGSVVSFGGGDVSGASFLTANNLNFTAVPEPSAALLGMIGALGLLRRRRN